MVLDYGGAQRIQRLSTFTTDKFQIKLPPQSVADLGVSESASLEPYSCTFEYFNEPLLSLYKMCATAQSLAN